ncbi:MULTISPECIES: hypothetical protein [Streptomycetaceae]|uniref:hypothetical protein n=1 Tax=Streptomycetaceae TaxID=2062 RepID=UPI00116126F7|nr:hypothetical protein [Streptomyces sp. CB02056]
MTAHPTHRPGLLIGLCTVAATGAVTAVLGAIDSRYGVCAVGLLILAGGALAAYRTALAAERRTDEAVRDRLRADPGAGPDAIAADLGLRPAAARLSLHRLDAADRLPSARHGADPGS